MRFRIVQVDDGWRRTLGTVVAQNASLAILLGLRNWPQQRRGDGTFPMLMTERVVGH